MKSKRQESLLEIMNEGKMEKEHTHSDASYDVLTTTTALQIIDVGRKLLNDYHFLKKTT